MISFWYRRFFSAQRLQFIRVVVLLVRRDLKIKYRDSFFGYLWSMLSPLLFMLVIYGVFSFAMKAVPNYHLHVLAGVLTWTLATTSITSGAHSIVNGAALLRKIKLPVWVLPSVPLGMSTTNFLLSLIPFMVVSILSGNFPTFKLLLLPIFLMIFFTFILGVTLTLSTFNVFFRDVGHVLEPVMSLIFYATPIIFDRHSPQIPPAIAKLMILNPFTHFVELVRACLISSIDISKTSIAIAFGYSLISLGIGLACYKKLKPRIMFRV